MMEESGVPLDKRVILKIIGVEKKVGFCDIKYGD